MSRAVPFAAGIPAVFVILWNLRSFGQSLRGFVLVVGIAALLLVLPATWFKMKSGWFTLASSTGQHLYDRVVSGQELFDETGRATSHLLRLASPLTAEDLKALWRAPGRSRQIPDLLLASGLTDRKMDSLLKRVAWEGIRQAPLAFIAYSFREAWTQYLDNPTDMITWWTLPGVHKVPELSSGAILGIHAYALLWRQILDQTFGVVWTYVRVIALGSLLSLWLLADPWPLLGLILMTSGYLFGLSLMELEVPRYTVAVVPFVFALAASPVCAGASLLSHFSELVSRVDKNDFADGVRESKQGSAS